MPRNLTAAAVTAVVASLCAALLSGCACMTGNDRQPSPFEFHNAPGPESLFPGKELLLYPRETVAPVGTEVILLAGVRDRHQYLVTNQRIEWTISQGSVGHFVDLGWESPFDYLVCDCTPRRVVDGTRAIGSTSRKYLRLTRGNTNPNDDVEVLRGQTWISVTSPQEGTSYVTAFSPDVYSWDLRQQSATIHWVDAQWQFPAPAINPAGTPHVFTTTVMKQTSQAPCVGWIVRYEIVGGPSAGFRPDGSPAIEVCTDAAGQASAEIFQDRAVPGTSMVNIQVIRPGSVGGGNGKRLIVGSGSTTKTWSAPGVSIRVSGPSVADVGSTVTYRIEVSNPGDLPAQDIVVAAPLVAGLEYLQSRPVGEVSGGAVRWQLPAVSPRQTETLEVDFRSEQSGRVEVCAEATISGGLSARDCVTTSVDMPDIEVQVLGPERATVGEEVTYEIVVTNRGQTPAKGLLIKDRFDFGLEHAELPSPIERDLGLPLGAGQSRSIGIVFRVTQSGELCHTVEVLRDGRVLASARTCLTGVERDRPQPSPGTEPQQPPPTLPDLRPQPPATRPRLSLQVSSPESRTVGETAEFVITVTNPGQTTVENIRVISDYDANLEPTMASPGFRFDGDDMFWVIDSLAPGASEEFKLQARCLAQADRACNRVRVVDEQGVLAEDEPCLEIRPAPSMTPSELSMVVVERFDSVPLNEPLTYVIRVTNKGQTPERQVSVVVSLPPELTLVPLETSGPPVAPRYNREGNSIRFNPVETLEPGASLEYRVRVRASQPGQVIVRAQLTSQRLDALQQPIVVEEDTLIFEE